MTVTHLSTLQATARRIVERAVIMEGQEIPAVAQNVLDSGHVQFILTGKLVEDIATEMQRLEMEAVQRYTAQSRSISANSTHGKPRI